MQHSNSNPNPSSNSLGPKIANSSRTTDRRVLEVDLHGYHPDDIDIKELSRQAWETGASELTFIHGHGRNRGIRPGRVNTNTGYFGLRVRGAIRRNSDLKPW